MLSTIRLLCIAFALFTACPAAAGENTNAQTEETANKRIEEGKEAARRNDHDAARVAFEQAYTLRPDPLLLRLLGASEILSGKTLQGARHLASWLEHSEASVDAKTAELVRARLQEAEAKLATLEFRVDAEGAQVIVDGELVGRAPISKPFYVEPGEHSVSASLGTAAAEARINVAKGKRATVELKLVRATSSESSSRVGPNATSPEDKPERSRGWSGAKTNAFIATAAVTVAGFGLATVFGLQASSAANEGDGLRKQAEERFGSAPCTTNAGSSSSLCASLDEARDSHDSNAQLANISLVAGGLGALATAAVLLFWKDEPKLVAINVIPQLDRGSAGIQFAGRF